MNFRPLTYQHAVVPVLLILVVLFAVLTLANSQQHAAQTVAAAGPATVDTVVPPRPTAADRAAAARLVVGTVAQVMLGRDAGQDSVLVRVDHAGESSLVRFALEGDARITVPDGDHAVVAAAGELSTGQAVQLQLADGEVMRNGAALAAVAVLSGAVPAAPDALSGSEA